MRILLDLQPLQTNIRYHGIGRVTAEIARRLIELFPEQTTLLFNSEKSGVALDFLKSLKRNVKREIFYCPGFENYYEVYHKNPSTYLQVWSFYELMLEYRVSEISPDVYLFFYFYAWENLSSLGKIRENRLNICLFYDLIPFIFRDQYLSSKPVRDFYEYKFKDSHLADFYFAISENTKKDMINLLKIPDSKIEVIPLGCSEEFRELELSEKIRWRQIFQEKFVLGEFILYNPSGADERKNLKTLLKAYSSLPPNLKNSFKLVITSRIDEARLRDFINYSKELAIDDKVIFTGYVSDEELCALYNLCKLFIFPSLYEGFGLPVLEAMSCGAPVLSSDRSSLPEIVVKRDAMFNPEDVNDIVEKIKRALESREYRNSLRENSRVQVKRFSYDTASKIISNTLRELGKNRDKRVFNLLGKISLAIVISSETLLSKPDFFNLFDELSNYYAVTLVTERKVLKERINLKTVDFEDFKGKGVYYERVLYILDENSESKIIKLLTLIPGVVILLDLKISKIIDDLQLIDDYLLIEQGVKSIIDYERERKPERGSEKVCIKGATNSSLGVIITSDTLLREIEQNYTLVSEELIKFLEPLGNLGEWAKKVVESIEEFYRRRVNFVYQELSKRFGTYPSVNLQSRLLSLNTKRIVERRRILFDVSILSKVDSGTGIQRVIKAQLSEMLNLLPKGFYLTAVRYSEDQKKYYNANNFLSKFTGVKIREADTPVFFREGDILYCPDLNYRGVIDAYNSGIFERAKIAGAKVFFLVHDLLPIKFPHYFSPGISSLHEEWIRIVLEVSNKVLCVSESVVDDLRSFANQRGIDISALPVISLHNGADFKRAKHNAIENELEFEIYEKLKEKPFFITVSTIEPRKGHRLLLQAFEILWREGFDYCLVFAGKKGWLVDELIDYMMKHPELNRRFFWLGYVSDQLLESLYLGCLATIVASEGEGFGLSIVEAAMVGSKVIARDIPVFREIGREGVFYFPDTNDPLVVAQYIKKWLDLYREGNAPESKRIKMVTWRENCEKLLKILID